MKTLKQIDKEINNTKRECNKLFNEILYLHRKIKELR